MVEDAGGNGEGGRRRPVIVVAASADPTASASVPLIGFHLAEELAGITPSVLVANAVDREGLLGRLPPDRVRFAGSAGLARALRRLGTRLFPDRWGLIAAVELPAYLVFDLHAYLVVRRLLRGGGADYVLRVNPVSLRVPSVLPRLPVPVFTGPHNGGMEWPEGFRSREAAERTGQRLRVVGDALHALFGDYRRYAGIFVASEACAAVVPARHRARTHLLSENGVDRVADVGPHAGDARRLLYVGRLTAVKAVDLAVRALARLPDDVVLTVVGDGPARPGLEALAAEQGVAARCRFLGRRPHAELDEHYGAAGVFVFPSVRESGGAVVLEAMAHGLPCLVAAWGGPKLYTADTGVQLSVASPEALVADLVGHVEAFLTDPALARHVGLRSREMVRSSYLWPSKAAAIDRVARRTLAARPGRPLSPPAGAG